MSSRKACEDLGLETLRLGTDQFAHVRCTRVSSDHQGSQCRYQTARYLEQLCLPPRGLPYEIRIGTTSHRVTHL